MKKIVFDKDTLLGEVLNAKKDARAVLMGFGLHCFDCPMAQMDTIESAAQIHGVDADLLLKKLNEIK